MKINIRHETHGSALAQIVEDGSFTALNKASDKRGHYQVNHDRRLLIKRSTTGPEDWQFTFSERDLDVLRDDLQNDVRVFACLVCAGETICALDADQIRQLINVDDESTKSIIVTTPPEPRTSMRVRGTDGELEGTVAHSAFPEKVFLE